MQKTSLQKIIVLPEFLSSDAYANTKRLFDNLNRRGESNRLDMLLSTVRVIQYQRQFYAAELHNLLAVATNHWPTRDVNVLVTTVNSKSELTQQLLTTASIYVIAQPPVSTVPSWQQAIAKDYAIKPLFSMREWSEILNKHRSSGYARKVKTITQPQMVVVDIDCALKAIPVPRRNSK